MSEHKPHSTQDDFSVVRASLGAWQVSEAGAALTRIEEQLESLRWALDYEQAKSHHYVAHGKPGVVSFTGCQATECVEARAQSAHIPASEPLMSFRGGEWHELNTGKGEGMYIPNVHDK